MPKYEIEIIKTIAERFIVTANDEDEAQEIAMDGDLQPDYTKFGEEIIDVEAVDESA